MTTNEVQDRTEGTVVPRKLSKRTLRKSWFSWFVGNLSSMSFEWLEAFGFAQSMSHVFKELYPNNREEMIAGLKRQSTFYNTEPQVGSLINGIAVGLEEERASGGEVDDEMINGVKVGLMGPLAGIGDAMIPGMYIPLLLSIAMGMAAGGNPAGPLFYIVVFLSSMTALSYWCYMKGYELGGRSIDFLVGDSAQRVRNSFNLLGALVVGGVAASYVNVTTEFAFPSGGEEPINVDETLNGIFPNLLGMLLVISCWWLMAKRRWSALKVMGVLLLLAVILVAISMYVLPLLG
ncbi:MAG: PTS system mannose/fructose/sorbose family transporter subunit IID [Propioniciclava sp.]